MAHPLEEEGEEDQLLTSGAGGVEMQTPWDAAPHRTASVLVLAAPGPCTQRSAFWFRAAVPSERGVATALQGGGGELCCSCFEQDAAATLVHTCACTAIQKFAHHACIQRWMQEKGHLRCEVCAHEYSARLSFKVPAPPPPAPVRETITPPLCGPVLILVDADRAAHRHAAALGLDDEEEHSPQRHWRTACCFTVTLIVLFLVVLYRSVLNPRNEDDGMDDDDDDGGGGGGGGASLLWGAFEALMLGIMLFVLMCMRNIVQCVLRDWSQRP